MSSQRSWRSDSESDEHRSLDKMAKKKDKTHQDMARKLLGEGMGRRGLLPSTEMVILRSEIRNSLHQSSLISVDFRKCNKEMTATLYLTTDNL
jgi:hypothetical protein